MKKIIIALFFLILSINVHSQYNQFEYYTIKETQIIEDGSKSGWVEVDYLFAISSTHMIMHTGVSQIYSYTILRTFQASDHAFFLLNIRDENNVSRTAYLWIFRNSLRIDIEYGEYTIQYYVK